MSEVQGHFRCYRDKAFRADALERIRQANEIITEFQEKGFNLTLRQLYYQHVARGLIANNDKEYEKLGALVSDGRLAGLISWTAIEDRDRHLRGYHTFKTPEGALKWLSREKYKLDLWEDQPVRPEVWVEKVALVDVIGQVCDKLRVDFFPCKGYVSQSAQWEAGQRMAARYRLGQRPVVLHLGDHDPSGLDMTRDNAERLSMFAGTEVQVIRLALNRAQVDRYQPPPNPAKVTDSRFADYQREHGDESWELDALSPQVIHDLIEDAVSRLRDRKLWGDALGREAADRQYLTDLAGDAGDEL